MLLKEDGDRADSIDRKTLNKIKNFKQGGGGKKNEGILNLGNLGQLMDIERGLDKKRIE